MAVQITDTEIAIRAKPLEGNRPYFLGDLTGKQGLDCLSGLLLFYGDALPYEFKGVNRDSYPILWKKDEKKAREILSEFLLTVGIEVDPKHKIRGDLCVFESEPGALWAGIYLGNGNLWICSGKKYGSSQISLSQLLQWTKEKLIAVRRVL